MATLNHIIGAIVAPLPLGLIFLLLGLLIRRMRKIVVPLALGWLWIFSTAAMVMFLGRPLEKAYSQLAVEDFPQADAICLLGGGMGVNTNDHIHAEMWGSADRVWRAAELWRGQVEKVGGVRERGLKIYCSGGLVEQSTLPLLLDFGIPREAIEFIPEARNTEEEAKLVKEKLSHHSLPLPLASTSARSKILLVTSAWHMRRAEMMFKKAGVETIPVACDYETLTRFGPCGWPRLCDFWPSADNLAMATSLFKEHYAFWAYRWLRGF